MKRFVSLILVVALVLLLVPTGLFCITANAAAEGDFTYEVQDGKAIITGCTLENNYVMEIPATIDGYPVVEIGAHAFEKHPQLLDVTIPEGVETIGAYAFCQCPNLTWLELPNSLITIGENAFFNCTSLTDLWLGYNLKTIGDGAFSFCYRLEGILRLPYKLEKIGMGAFYDCNSLEELVLPDSLKELGSKAFAMCDRLEYVVMPSDLEKLGANAFYQSACYNSSYNWDGGVFCMGSYVLNAKTNLSGSYEVWPRITHIADEAFLSCSNLTEIILPEDLKIIGAAAFKDCKGLESVVLPAGVTTIEDQAFYNCKALSDIQIPDSVAHIGQDAFQKTAFYSNAENWENGALYAGNCLVQCNSSVSGTLQVRYGTKMIVSGAIKEQKRLTEIILPDTVTTIGEKALYGCSGLKSVYFGKSVSQIGAGAFGQCSSLESIAVHSENENYFSQGNCLISRKNQTLVLGCKTSQIPTDGSVNSIGAFAFEGCIGLTEITIPDTVFTIGEGAFRECDELTTVNLGNGVQVVGKRAFEECDVLSQVDLGQSVHTIDDYGFAYNHQIAHIEFPASLRYLGEEAFSNNTGLVTATFQEGIVSIGKNCFIFCENLTSLYLPDTLQDIQDGAFYSCEKISTLIFGNGLTSIGDAAFDGCKALTVLIIPDTVQTIGKNAFYECTSLKQVDLGSVQKIGYAAFESCINLTQIHIPATVTELGTNVFSYCVAMSQMTVSPQNPYYHSQDNCIIRTKDKYLLSGCKNSIIPADGSVKTIGAYSFAGCRTLKSIVVPDQVTGIRAYAFYECTGLEEMQLPFVGGEKAYDNYIGFIFGGGPAENDIYVPATLKRVVITGGAIVGNSAFSECSGLQEVVLPESITTIGYDAFANCSQLQRVIVPGELNAIKSSNILNGSPYAKLYISAGQENTRALAESKGLPYQLGGMVTFIDDQGQVIEKTWYFLGGIISLPTVAEKPADEHYTYEISWNPVPEYCIGNQTIQLSYVARERTGCEVLGHSYDTNDTAPTCTEQGYTTYSCSVCGDVYVSDYVAANGHDWLDATCTAAQTCVVCGVTEGEPLGHSYKNGTCSACGEKDPDYQPMIQWAGSNVTLGGALALNFAFDTNQLNGTTGNYIVLTRSYADGKEDDVVTIPQSEWVSAGGSYIQVSYTNMAAKEMGDKITAVVYNADGKVISETRTDSMAEYSARMLVRADIVASAEKRTLFVDMLNYGAAAQVYFQYNEKNLVNAGLTEEQAGWASAAVKIGNYRETSGCYFGSSLSLEEEIYLQVAFGTAYEEGMYATVSFTDHYGKLVEKRVAVAASGSYSVVQVEGMAIADYRALVTCTLYSANGTALGSTIDSIESYAARMVTSLQKNGADLGDAIMKLGASSYAYFH